MMEGRRLTADQARDLGLADEVVPPSLLQKTAGDVAERLAAGPTRAIGLLKRCVYQGYGRPIDEGLALEAQAVSELIRTADAREGMEAFLAKRPPRFRGI
jgi:enoyl-CoA hydratase/carnithine racemase